MHRLWKVIEAEVELINELEHLVDGHKDDVDYQPLVAILTEILKETRGHFNALKYVCDHYSEYTAPHTMIDFAKKTIADYRDKNKSN